MASMIGNGGDVVRQETRVLVVDDERGISDLIAMGLRYEGLTVQVAETGSDALRAVETFQPDLLILDVMLPDIDGFEVLLRLSVAKRSPPIVFLSARGELEDKLRGFTLGGDEYITKPFSMEELVVRTRAILRRANMLRRDSAILQFEDLALHEEHHEVRRGETVLDLTPTEFKLLHYLLLNPNRVMSRAQIRDRVWQYDFDGHDNAVEIFISSLRRKMEVHGPRLIHTVRGIGYRLRRPDA
jgi:two-component system OmpR family response regulator